MKLMMLFICAFMTINFSFVFAQDNLKPKTLHCLEGKYRLLADFTTNEVNIFERDSFTQKERNLFGINHYISNYRMGVAKPSLTYYSIDLKIKNDGILKGKFQLEIDPENNARKGMIQYEGWYSWEPIIFNDCSLYYSNALSL
jgi:hypothetical protein